ncbi:MAG TPA: ABC transporter ATP-binding protein [Tepidisphaeraceae bacterium]|jgi:molybdate transport system ATP-binding protein
MTDALVAAFERRYPSGAIVRATLTQAVPGPRITVLFGPSGSGKTTILRCLAGLDAPQAGSIRFGSHTWFDATRHINLRPQQRGVGFLFQDYALFPHLTVAQNIGYGLHGAARVKRIEELLQILDLPEMGSRYPNEISAGQQQRVALARAIAPRPGLLLLDEPLSALDARTRETLRRELRQLLTQFQTPAVVVTHDPIEAVALADDAVILDQGRVLQSGTVQDVFSRPADPTVAHIVGIETVEPGEVISVAEGLAIVRVGKSELLAVASGSSPGPVYVCIRGEDVILERGHPEHTSARNQLPARILWLAPEGPLVRVGLECGFSLTALITRPASLQLALTPGQNVTALIKAPSIHLVGR